MEWVREERIRNRVETDRSRRERSGERRKSRNGEETEYVGMKSRSGERVRGRGGRRGVKR